MTGRAPIDVGDLLNELAASMSPYLVEPMARRVVELLREHDATDADGSWLDSAEAARYLGVSRDTLRKLAAAGQMPSEQDGPRCKRYFRRSDLDAWRQGGGRAAHLRRIA